MLDPPFLSSSSSPWSALWWRWWEPAWCPPIPGPRGWFPSAGCGWCGWWWLKNLTAAAAAAAWWWACIVCWTCDWTCPRTGWCGCHAVKWNGNTGADLGNKRVGVSREPPDPDEPPPGGGGNERPPPGSRTIFGTNFRPWFSYRETLFSFIIYRWGEGLGYSLRFHDLCSKTVSECFTDHRLMHRDHFIAPGFLNYHRLGE